MKYQHADAKEFETLNFLKLTDCIAFDALMACASHKAQCSAVLCKWIAGWHKEICAIRKIDKCIFK